MALVVLGVLVLVVVEAEAVVDSSLSVDQQEDSGLVTVVQEDKEQDQTVVLHQELQVQLFKATWVLVTVVTVVLVVVMDPQVALVHQEHTVVVVHTYKDKVLVQVAQEEQQDQVVDQVQLVQQDQLVQQEHRKTATLDK